MTLLAAPMFHAWGWMHHRMATVLDHTQVLLRHPDPERLLALVQAYEVDTIITVPVTLKRLVDLPAETKDRYDFSSVQCVAVSGSAIPGDLATEFMDDFGDVLYNLYGTTEAAYATIATPEDLREDPHTAGRPMPGVRVEVLDRKGRSVPKGKDGRVYVRSRTSIAEYMADGTRGSIKGMVPTGDIGCIDADGRLTIKGRADDVVVTGGENVHPTEVEEVLRLHPGIADVAVTGRPDSVYGSVLVAHVVLSDSGLSDEELLDWARHHLGPHHRPREVRRLSTSPSCPATRPARSCGGCLPARSPWTSWTRKTCSSRPHARQAVFQHRDTYPRSVAPNSPAAASADSRTAAMSSSVRVRSSARIRSENASDFLPSGTCGPE